ncbi:HPP family protein [Natrinema marinum]|uniref:HPP family protein n=1 Tax=Natrinema marinum TaxID=2961598 RepID=UPI0020C8CDED|nr:HPP family protein [Natrinema marinum]
MREGAAVSTLYAGVLLAVPGALAWLTGEALLFPSLGPSAFLLATGPDGEATRPRRVIGGHLVGIAAGLVAYHTIAPGLVVTASAPMLAGSQFRLVASGVLAVALTSGGMLATETGHPPACATTLIVSLGLLPSLVDGALIAVAVVVLVVVHELATRTRNRSVSSSGSSP